MDKNFNHTFNKLKNKVLLSDENLKENKKTSELELTMTNSSLIAS